MKVTEDPAQIGLAEAEILTLAVNTGAIVTSNVTSGAVQPLLVSTTCIT